MTSRELQISALKRERARLEQELERFSDEAKQKRTAIAIAELAVVEAAVGYVEAPESDDVVVMLAFDELKQVVDALLKVRASK